MEMFKSYPSSKWFFEKYVMVLGKVIFVCKTMVNGDSFSTLKSINTDKLIWWLHAMDVWETEVSKLKNILIVMLHEFIIMLFTYFNQIHKEKKYIFMLMIRLSIATI